jgi:undecaprenyl-diphosphatase
MTLFEAIAYGLVQGLGEFLPISSSAHLVLLPWMAGWKPHGLAFDVALHLGTLLSLLVYFRVDLLRLARAFLASVVERRVGDDLDRRLAWMVVLGSVPGAVIGLALERQAEERFRSPALIACTLIGMGVALYLVDTRARSARPLDGMTFRDALWVGLGQACAIVPGVSRSGSTITVGRLLGLSREAAARFSFLLSAPIVAGAGLLKVPKLWREGGVDLPLVVGIVVAAVSGWLAIEVLLRLIRTRSYLPFAVYRVAAGAVVLVVYFTRG